MKIGVYTMLSLFFVFCAIFSEEYLIALGAAIAFGLIDAIVQHADKHRDLHIFLAAPSFCFRRM